MNVRMYLAAASIGLLTLVACDAGGDGRANVVVGDSTAIDAIAGDKNEVAKVLRRAHDRGTLDDALSLALDDSTLAVALAAALREDSRFLTAGEPMIRKLSEAPSTTPAETKATKRSTGSNNTSTNTNTSTTTRKGDVLDQTERTAQKVNERLDQAARVKREAEEAKRQVEDIIGRKP
ncbi:MAG: hypothetical protein H7X80_06060 [bacterium]|nr:hypothetical protein [Candidatus Kapabacteria bacterium]